MHTRLVIVPRLSPPTKSLGMRLSYSIFSTCIMFSSRNKSSMLTLYMWQSLVEIEHYSVVYFDRITAFKAL